MASNNPAYDTPQDVLDSHAPPAEAPRSSEPPAEIFQSDSPITGEPAAPAPLPAPVDPYADFGGREEVERRYQAVEAWGTEEGLTVAAVEALRGLGFEQDVIESLFNWEAPEPEYLPDIEDDAPLTKADVIRLAQQIADQRVGRVEESFEQAQERQQYEAATHAAVGALQALGVQDEKTKQGTLTLAQAYISPDEWDPQVIEQAVRRGHADWMSVVQASREEYLQGKVATRDSLPRNIGGHSQSPGEVTSPVAKPRSLDEAIRAVRDKARSEGW